MTAPHFLGSLARRQSLAIRGLWAGLWILIVEVGPSLCHLKWSSATGTFWPALFGATLLLAWPPLQCPRQGTTAGPQESKLGLALSSAIFAPAVLVPAFLLAPLPGPRALAALLLLPLAAACGTTRSSRRPSYALLLTVAAIALAMAHHEPGSSMPMGGTKEPGSSMPMGGTKEPGSGRLEGGRAWPVSFVREGGGDLVMALDGFAPLVSRGGGLDGERVAARGWMVGPERVGDWGLFADRVAARPLEGAGLFRLPSWAHRTGPSIQAARGGWPVAGLLVVLAGLVGGSAVQRAVSPRALARIGAQVLVGVGAAAGVQRVQDLGGDGVEARTITVLEGQRAGDGATEWVRVERSFGVFEWAGGALEGAFSGEIVVDGERGIARTERNLRAGEEVARIVATDANASIDWRRPYAAGLRILMAEVNTWGDFDAAWERTGGGEWRAVGPWPRGAALPEGPPRGAQELPGWCVSGLPQGVSVFVGHLDGAWVRLVGFRPR